MPVSTGHDYLELSVAESVVTYIYDEYSGVIDPFTMDTTKDYTDTTSREFFAYYNNKVILKTNGHNANFFWGINGTLSFVGTDYNYYSGIFGHGVEQYSILKPTIFGRISGVQLSQSPDLSQFSFQDETFLLQEAGGIGRINGKTADFYSNYIGIDFVSETLIESPDAVVFKQDFKPFAAGYFKTIYVDIGPTTLFTDVGDRVDFNSLDSTQVGAIIRGSALYDDLGGNDTVHLPTSASAANLGGSGVSYDFAHPFQLGDGNDVLYGSDANTTVSLGSGLVSFRWAAGFWG